MATIWSCVAFGQQVAGDLLDDELVVGQVAVEGVDDPVAIEPDVARLVLLEAVASRRSGPRRASAGPSARRSAARRAAARPASRRRRATVSARKASTSAIVGGRPMRSSDRRRRSVGLVGLGRGREPFLLEPREDEGVDRRLRPGGVLHLRHRGRTGRLERPVILALVEHGLGNLVGLGRSAVSALTFVFTSVTPAGYFAPASIHARSRPICCAVSVTPSFFGGIGMSSTRPATRRIRALWSLCPSTMTCSFSSPPLRSPARVSRRKLLFCLVSPWQRTQVDSRSGLMSLSKSRTARPAEAGRRRRRGRRMRYKRSRAPRRGAAVARNGDPAQVGPRGNVSGDSTRDTTPFHQRGPGTCAPAPPPSVAAAQPRAGHRCLYQPSLSRPGR